MTLTALKNRSLTLHQKKPSKQTNVVQDIDMNYNSNSPLNRKNTAGNGTPSNKFKKQV
jgi:hypothetical protein